MSGATQKRYSNVAIILHWLIAILVIANWRLAENAEHTSVQADKMFWMGQHKAIGISILVLSVLRLLWRFWHKPPPFDPHMAGWERKLAHFVHIIFYVLLIGLPVGGWLASSFAGYSISMWGLFDWPLFPVAESKETAKQIAETHGTLGKAMLILILLHVAGALKHSLIDKIPSFSRMWFGNN